ncbi:PAS domain S-box-containing protein [Sphingomonas jinjuensis]|uniref:histidine kinase n=1 Tax=Sphingomonas jinjuensis TaxID=535907 RepID=A0A840F9Z4_9SPHN|nr:PAS domain-containing protein [Sphingomonas jinjuensis]MBB4152594.1 PAS domain S-box-containing protein [Sphingomonas jinjuensis]
MAYDEAMAAARRWCGPESERVAEVEAHAPAATHDTRALEEALSFAAALCGVPTAFVSLVGATEQRLVAKVGTDLETTNREVSFCQWTIREGELMVVPDALADPRFADGPLVVGPPHIRFYAGAPLVARSGAAIGSLCVIDTEPHPDGLTPLQMQGMRVLAASVMARLRDRREAEDRDVAVGETRRALSDSENRFRTLADTMPQMVWSTLPDGYHDYYNARWYEFTGTPPGSTDGEGWNDMFHPDDQDRAWTVWRHSLDTGDPYQIEYRLRHADGTYRWVLGRALPIRDEQGAITRWFGTCTDIHQQKLALEEREIISQELSHRIKNIFAVIAGLIGFAARRRPEFGPAASDLRDRITALGRAHDFVRPHSHSSRPMMRQDSLIGLLGELFAPYERSEARRFVIEGDDVAIDDRSATPLALLFHELATNASKYGALANDRGHVAITLSSDGPQVTIGWREQGGPPVTAPAEASGFGSQLIEMSAVRQLGGTVERAWPAEGLAMTVRLPAAALSRG